MTDTREHWIEAFRYVRKKDLLAALDGVPDDAILYRSPVTAALVVCEQTGPEIDMSDDFIPYSEGNPVMAPEIGIRGLVAWHSDGSCGFESISTD